jgi:type II secretory pathway component PulF
MSYFSYHAVDVDGKAVKGSVQADSPRAAQDDLIGKGLYVIDLTPSGGLSNLLDRLASSRSIKRSDVIEFANNLSVMLKAGLPILTAMNDIIATTDNRAMRQVLVNVKQNIEMGGRFSDSVERFPAIFPDIFLRLVRVGEETGGFERSLAEVSEHLQKIEDLKSAIKRALIYPAFAIVATLGALVFWMLFVLPKIIDTMVGMGVKLPLLTRFLIGASQYTQKYWYLLIIVPVAIAFLIKLIRRTAQGRYAFDLLALKTPIVKMIVYNKLIALFSEQMRILIMAGLTIDKTFDLVASVIGNEVYRRGILRVKETVMYGSLISEAIREQNLFPTLVVRMINIGETSGTLDNQFSFLATHFSKKLDAISDNLGKIIEPVVIGTIGGLFAIIIMGLMLPIYDLVSQMGKG